MGCNQYIARHGGGTAVVDLPPGQKLITATWKETSLWYLTRPMKSVDSAETYYFKESSALGVVEGTIIFKESKVVYHREK